MAALTTARPSGCSEARSTPAASRSSSSRSNPRRGTIWVTDGRPSVRVPVLSTTRVSTFSISSSASAFLISTPSPAPRPTPTMIDIGVARPSAQGQAMIRTVTATMSACASRGSGPTVAQTRNATTATTMTAGTNQAATRSAMRWIGARERWASATICTIRASIVSRPILSARMTSEPGLVHGAADDGVAGRLGDRHRLAGHQRLVQRGAAVLDGAVDRDRLAGADPQPVADLDQVEADLVLGAVRR